MNNRTKATIVMRLDEPGYRLLGTMKRSRSSYRLVYVRRPPNQSIIFFPQKARRVSDHILLPSCDTSRYAKISLKFVQPGPLVEGVGA